MADWSVRFYLDYTVEAESRGEAVEKAKKELIEELQNNIKVAIPDSFQVAVVKEYQQRGIVCQQ